MLAPGARQSVFPLVLFWLLLAMVLVGQALWLLLLVTHYMLFCLQNRSKLFSNVCGFFSLRTNYLHQVKTTVTGLTVEELSINKPWSVTGPLLAGFNM